MAPGCDASRPTLTPGIPPGARQRRSRRRSLLPPRRHTGAGAPRGNTTMGTCVDPVAAGTLLERAVSYSPMLCAHCASPLPDGSRFCVNCGADLEEPSSGATASLDDAGVVKLTRMLR